MVVNNYWPKSATEKKKKNEIEHWKYGYDYKKGFRNVSNFGIK